MGMQNPARCVNVNAQAYATSSISIAQDFIILLVPVPWLARLNVGLRKKINILLMFSIGILQVSFPTYISITDRW